MKKKILLILLIISSFFILNKVYASTYLGKISVGNYIYGPYYYVNELGNYRHYATFQVIKNSEGNYVYCLEPLVEVDQSKSYQILNGNEEIINSNILRQDIYNKISKIAYYGYGYQGHNEEKWYVATQMLIWKIVRPDINSYFTTTLNGSRDDTILKSEMEEINYLVSKDNLSISLNNYPNNLAMSDSVNILDNNSVLSDYELVYNGQNNVSINDNSLNIYIKKIEDIDISLVKKYNYYQNNINLFYSNDSQNVILKGNLPSKVINLPKIEVSKGYFTLNLYNYESKICDFPSSYTVEGIKFGLYTMDDELIEELIVDSNCQARTSKKLVYSNYKVRQLTTNKNHLLNPNNTVIAINNPESSHTLYRNIGKSDIVINSYDSVNKSCTSRGGASLYGAKYGIYNMQDELIKEVNISYSCSNRSYDFYYGDYYIKEISSSKGYKKDDKKYEVTLGVGLGDQTVNIYKDIIESKIQINKYDYYNNQLALNGAIYAIYNTKNELIEELNLDEKNISNNLIYDDYYLIEIKAPKGYNLDINKKYFSINNEINKIINVYDKIIENNIIIYKKYQTINNELLNESDITFEIYYPDNKLFKEVITNNDGYVSFKLPYGTWVVHQKNSKVNYLPVDDFNIIVDDKSNINQEFNLVDKLYSTYLKVNLYDSEFNKLIKSSNAVFKILNKELNEYVTYNIDGEVFDTFSTNDGSFITPIKLLASNYDLIEVKEPNNYELNNLVLNFKLEETNKKNNYITLDYQNNPIKMNIKIIKEGEDVSINNNSYNYDNKVYMNSVSFNIYAKDDILNYYNGEALILKDTLVDTVITSNGVALTNKLYLGNYYVKETSTNDNYILDDKIYDIDLTKENELKIFNKLKKGQVNIKIIDKDSKEELVSNINIYNNLDEVIYQGESGIINDLILGDYYVFLDSINDYIIEDKYEFKIENNAVKVDLLIELDKINNDIKFTNIDVKENNIILKVPNTFNNDNHILEFILVVIIIISLMAILKITNFKYKRNIYLFLIIALCLSIIFYKNYLSLNNSEEQIKIDNYFNNVFNSDYNKDQSNFVAVLEIPKIKLKKGLFDKNSPFNNLKNSIYTLKESTYPKDKEISHLFLASHSGNSKISYFKNLSKLNLNDYIYLYFNNNKYIYKIIDIYEIEKSGYLNYSYNDFNEIILITCKDNSSKQLVFVSKSI